MPAAIDPRWIILAEDGAYSTIGRHREPSDEDLQFAEEALSQVGRAGWLAIMSHSSHLHCCVQDFVLVRALGQPGTTFDQAVQAFLSKHEKVDVAPGQPKED